MKTYGLTHKDRCYGKHTTGAQAPHRGAGQTQITPSMTALARRGTIHDTQPTPAAPVKKPADEKPFSLRFVGLSGDRRTNRWEITCHCGKQWTPPSTMLAKREEQCPRCDTVQLVDYNYWVDQR